MHVAHSGCDERTGRTADARDHGPRRPARHGQNDRPIVIGRKNWLFSDTPAGANASTKLDSIIETAKANGLEPYAYLRHLFEKLPQAITLADVEALLPWNVAKATASRRWLIRQPSSGNRRRALRSFVGRLRRLTAMMS